MASQLFDNVAEDHFQLFEGKEPKYSDVAKKLDLKNSDVAVATGVPTSSVRFDERIPKEISIRLREWANLLNLVADHFDGDVNKTILWFTLPNPLLGSLSPRDMIRLGRYKKLYKFVMNSLAENPR